MPTVPSRPRFLMRYSFVATTIAASLTLCGPSLPAWSAEPLQAVRTVETLERRLLDDAADGRCDKASLLEAAIIAGGVDDEKSLRAAQERLTTLWREVDRLPAGEANPRARARLILLAMHRLVLTGKYDADCTEVHRTLATGDYNCVTASLLYLHFCRRYGLEAVAVASPGHVYCRLLGTPAEDVQTTCSDWFDVRRRGDAIVPGMPSSAASASSRELTDVELLGKVYYNRGVSRLEKNEFAESLRLLHIAERLDPRDEPAHNNLLAGYNNWALALCDAGDFAGAAAKLADGRAIDAKYGPLQTNDLHVHQRWALHLCDRGRYSEAVQLLEAGFKRRPDAGLYDGGRFAVYGLWTRSLLEAERTQEAEAVLQSARRLYGDHPDLLQQELEAFEAGVARMVQQRRYASARTMLDSVLQRHPAAESLQRLAQKVADAK